MTQKNPLFLRFINSENTVSDILQLFSQSTDKYTAETAVKTLDNPPNLEQFKEELTAAVNDLIQAGMDEAFKAFVNHYMEDSIVEDVTSERTQFGENVSRIARLKDENTPWVEAFICYNLVLYIKGFGLDCLKKCRVCGKIFAHKGKYAVYCSNPCKSKGSKESRYKEPDEKSESGTL